MKRGGRGFGVEGEEEEEGGERGRASPRPSLTRFARRSAGRAKSAQKEGSGGGGEVVARPGRMRGAPPRAEARAGAPCR